MYRSRMLRTTGWDDYVLIATQAFFTACMTSLIVGSLYGFGHHFEELTEHNGKIARFVSSSTTSSAKSCY